MRTRRKPSNRGRLDPHAEMRAHPVLELPAPDSFDDDEALWARVAVGIARGGGAMFQGRLLECRIARLLNASFPCQGISPWDLRLRDGILVEVRSGSRAFSLRGNKHVDVWIFVPKADTREYFVATAEQVAELRRRTTMLSIQQARHILGAVPESRLLKQVRVLVRRRR
jgi:hypothetical protein